MDSSRCLVFWNVFAHSLCRCLCLKWLIRKIPIFTEFCKIWCAWTEFLRARIWENVKAKLGTKTFKKHKKDTWNGILEVSSFSKCICTLFVPLSLSQTANQKNHYFTEFHKIRCARTEFFWLSKNLDLRPKSTYLCCTSEVCISRLVMHWTVVLETTLPAWVII